ncbi:hypothetical protein SAMN06298226_2872 [Nitrosovibrio sp. Nv4]|nr:hypothetical protein SAMN06298226_2872 [Nitrosovibrio sp. Nv4]
MRGVGHKKSESASAEFFVSMCSGFSRCSCCPNVDYKLTSGVAKSPRFMHAYPLGKSPGSLVIAQQAVDQFKRIV